VSLKKIRIDTAPKNENDFSHENAKHLERWNKALFAPYLLLLLLYYIYIKQELTEPPTSPKFLFQVPFVKLSPLERWNTFIIKDLQG
jgi:hypothetical protein